MAAPPAVPIAAGVWRIPTVALDLVNSFLFVGEDGEATLVDAGLRGAPRKVLAGLARAGVAPEQVTRILLTHAHPDHTGGAAELRTRTAATTVSVHTEDLGFVEAGTTAPMRRTLGLRPPPRRVAALSVTEALHDGQLLPVAGGLRVLHTPGHTPGHVSLLHEPTGTLVTGDALFNMTRRITWPVAAFCTDAAMTRRTAQRLGGLDFDVAAFTHGPEIRTGARAAVRRFLERRGAGR